MNRGLYVPNFGASADPRFLVELACEAESVGWDGFFLWDHVARSEANAPVVETWACLSAIAASTSQIRFGPLVTPLPRRRPWNVARAAVTLDSLSEGRLILGVGAGTPRGPEFSAFGEEPSLRLRGEMLDEGLALIREIWTGDPVDHFGAHYRVQGARFLPRPAQSGGIPVWAAAESLNGRVLRRAAMLDGIFPLRARPNDVAALVAAVDRFRTNPSGPFSIVAATAEAPDQWENTGLSWWLRRVPYDMERTDLRKLVARGPSA